jgi:hypothetical protein
VRRCRTELLALLALAITVPASTAAQGDACVGDR